MNFDTKHLVRWGIPGWTLIMLLFPFIFFEYQKEIVLLIKEINALALGAFLTVIGVPLGFLLNQIHHSLFWVTFNKKYEDKDEYFKKELLLDELFMDGDKEGEFKKERYRYLLSRKHELGGLMISLAVSVIVIFFSIFFNLINHMFSFWTLIYFLVNCMLLYLIFLSRNYSEDNLNTYFDTYVQQAEQNTRNNTDQAPNN